MFYKPTTRLFVIKFLGIFGGSSISSAEQKDAAESIKSDQQQQQQQHQEDVVVASKKQVHVATVPQLKDIANQTNQSEARGANLSRAIESSNRKILDLMLEKGIPGMTVCVAKRGDIVWRGAFGYCDVENQLECQQDARMRIASISKSLFAATIVAPMIEQNKLCLESSIYKYLPVDEFPKKTFNDKEVDITIGQLLSHTAGIVHYSDKSPETSRPIGSSGSKRVYQQDAQYERSGYYQRKTYRNVSEALQVFKDEPLIAEPGTKYNYTTNGFVLLSAVVEKARQQQHQQEATDDKLKKEQIEDFWQKVLHRDWKLTETSLDQDEPILSNRARYYLRAAHNGSLINAPYTDNSIKWAGGGLVSSVGDLVKFGNALIDSYKNRNEPKLRRETIDLLWKEQKDYKYGLGFSLEALDSGESGGEKVAVYHTGWALGASSVLIIYPESETVVAILTNLGWLDLKPLGLHIANQFTR